MIQLNKKYVSELICAGTFEVLGRKDCKVFKRAAPFHLSTLYRNVACLPCAIYISFTSKHLAQNAQPTGTDLIADAPTMRYVVGYR